MSSDRLIQCNPSVGLPHNFPHGGGVEASAAMWGCDVSDILDLSTGLHPSGQPDWLAAWLYDYVDLVAHYPDSNGEPARTVLAHEFGVVEDQVLITAGAQAVIEVVFQAMAWKSLAIRVPCYSEPIRCAKRAGCEVHAIEYGDNLPVTDAYWHTSPSNPFGKVELFPEALTGVLDESYLPFSERRLLGVVPKVIRLGSLTKNFCIPGLRLGYVIADKQTIAGLKSWLPPWPASTLGLHLLPKLLLQADQRDHEVEVARARLILLLQQYDWQYQPSQASFVLAQPPSSLPDFSLEKIMVRAFPEWPQLQGWIRFGLPNSEDDWQRLEAVLCR